MKIAFAEGLPLRLVVAAGAATVLLLVVMVVGTLLVASRGVPDPVYPAAESLMASGLQLTAGRSMSSGAMVERPLFWSSRRPLDVAEMVKEEPQRRGPDPLDKATLLGVFDAGGISGVILKMDGERRRILLGNDVSDWRLISLSPDSATFARLRNGRDKGEERVLKLEHAMVAAPRQEPSGDAEAEKDLQTETP